MDKPDLLTTTMMLVRLEGYGGRVCDVRFSASGGGLHIVAFAPDASYATRVLLGDDPLRAEYDEYRPPELRGVLFRRELN